MLIWHVIWYCWYVFFFSAGIGRTGTFIALDYLLDETAAQDCVDTQACLHKLRYARFNMVQNLVGIKTPLLLHA